MSQASEDQIFINRAVEASIRIGLVALLVLYCFRIIQPFVEPIVWGIVIAVATYPAYRYVERAVGGRRELAAALFTLAALVLLITPTVMLTATLIGSTQELSGYLTDGDFEIPPPPEMIGRLPLVGGRLEALWSGAARDPGEALQKIEPQLMKAAGWLVSTGATTGLGVLKFVISLVIAGALLARASGGASVAVALATRFMGARGAAAAGLAAATVQSVARGILGVALIQALLAAVGLLAAGVPVAGFWALIVLILCVIQLPPLLILGPIIVYVFMTSSTLIAVLFTIWSLFVGVIDSFLKPIFLGRGVEVPMLVIFIGSIGGFVLNGVIGLFVGAVVLSLGYKLLVAWIDDQAPEEESAGREPD